MKEIQKKAKRPKTLIGSEQTCSHISVQPLKGLDKELEEAERKIPLNPVEVAGPVWGFAL